MNAAKLEELLHGMWWWQVRDVAARFDVPTRGKKTVIVERLMALHENPVVARELATATCEVLRATKRRRVQPRKPRAMKNLLPKFDATDGGRRERWAWDPSPQDPLDPQGPQGPQECVAESPGPVPAPRPAHGSPRDGYRAPCSTPATLVIGVPSADAAAEDMAVDGTVAGIPFAGLDPDPSPAMLYLPPQMMPHMSPFAVPTVDLGAFPVSA